MRAWFRTLTAKLTGPDMVNALKAAARTGVAVAATFLVPAVLGFLADFTEWASSEGATIAFPDPSVLTKAAVSTGYGLLAAAGTLAYRALQALDILPGYPPHYGFGSADHRPDPTTGPGQVVHQNVFTGEFDHPSRLPPAA